MFHKEGTSEIVFEQFMDLLVKIYVGEKTG
jgi:hypothetical protein